METLQILLSNIHCNDCVNSIKSSLSTLLNLNSTDTTNSLLPKVLFSIDNNKITISSSHLNFFSNNNSFLQIKIISLLKKSGFNISFVNLTSTLSNHQNDIDTEFHIENCHNKNEDNKDEDNKNNNTFNPLLFYEKFKNTYILKNNYKRHLDYCKVCQELEKGKELEKKKSNSKKNIFHSSFSSNETSETIVNRPLEVLVVQPSEFRAVFAISGMTCSSCAATVHDTIKNALQKHYLKKLLAQKIDDEIFVDIITNNTIVIIPNKQIANEIVSSIREVGFNCSLLEVLPIERSQKFKVIAAIGGITCASCASIITSSVSNLPFLEDSAINVVSKVGFFIINSNNKENISQLKETIEDCGYDFDLVEIKEVDQAVKKNQSRTINLKVDGMFCNKCPESVNNLLKSFGKTVVVSDPITLSRPFVKLTYLSSESLTIRKIMQKLDEVSPVFKVELVKPISIDSHLKKMAKLEIKKIIIRLALTSVIAIPTFVFGVVGMSLIKKDSSFMKWLNTPIFKTNISRNEWILFFLATPVYFFVADIFHRKAIREIYNLWKPHNSWYKRFFKFGSMSLLMCLGTSIAYFSSVAMMIVAGTKKNNHHKSYSTNYFDTVVFLTFFLLIGKLLESYSKIKTADAISNLGELKPKKANLIENNGLNNRGMKVAIEDLLDQSGYGNDKETSLDFLEVGDIVRIYPGNSPPADSIILLGSSKFDESALTGESNAITRQKGDQIFAGTINVGSSSVIAKVSSENGTTLIDQIVNTVRDAQQHKAPIERTADKLTGYFVPLIALFAVLTWVIWISLGYGGVLPQRYLDAEIGGWAVWSLEFAIAVFVIACPCGIGLAAPTAIYVGSGLAAKNGILARGGGAAFEEGSKINVVCFDKTGTLTNGGEPQVTNFSFIKQKILAKNLQENNDKVLRKMVFQITRDLELNSSHPLSVGIKNFISEICKNEGIEMNGTKVQDVEEIPGNGLRGKVTFTGNDDEYTYWNKYKPLKAILGNENLMEKNNSRKLTAEDQSKLTKWKNEGKSIIVVSIEFESIGNFVPVLIMAARDELRREAKDVIKALHEMKIDCWVVSGDNEITAKAIAREVGIPENHVVSEVLPEEKANKIKWIQNGSNLDSVFEENKNKKVKVAMIGDGINDAPALGAANIGIALGSGSDLALTSSDFILLSKEYPLMTLLTLLKLSNKVFNRVRFNFGWALIYNCIGIPIAAGVIYPYKNSRLSPVWASAAMAASSVSVVLSSLALRLFKKPAIVEESYLLKEENRKNELVTEEI
ncbi:heavy metal translocating P-type ATPase [Ascoidea rubescens DSM 1968]|uniref:Heavy metal translocatin n=1 Tax=Ascoidea rubescens DSM 1968 TaxID=1344418 RepID=A0A1D2VKA5_9ASCO|nr:heavy metal translocatin [Ascoidea rubescens DSM 1968]ODV62040.1 heavy metal translocatin [Ascoidea rubescens DSM 1968]